MLKIGLLTAFLITMLMLSSCATPPMLPIVAVNDPLRLGNPRAAFVVAIQTNREPLRVGNSPRLSLRTTTSGYMNLYFINPSGKTGQLLTNYPVHAHEIIVFPPTTSKQLQYTLAPPIGVENFILVVTQQPLNLLSRRDISNVKKPRTAIAEFNLNGPQLINRLRDALYRWPPSAWNADSVQLPLITPAAHS